MKTKQILEQGGLEKLGLKDSFLKHSKGQGEKEIIKKEIAEHTAGIEFILSVLTNKENGVLTSLHEIDAVGHRVVHGGERFNSSILITDEVIEKIEECISLAPLHNLPNLKGIRAIEKLMPGVAQVAVFDTAFHQTMPEKAYMYALPYELYSEKCIRRFGFHGTSHHYVSARAFEILNLNPEGTKMITCHIGNGGSITAIKDGKSIDTSMGMTPLEGLIMGTRAGDIDAGTVLFLMEQNGYSIEDISKLLNNKSGLLGISGVSSDMRDIQRKIEEGNQRATLAVEMFQYRIKKYIGAYIAALGGLDILVFTGGIGENNFKIRQLICKDLEYLGISINEELNNGSTGEEIILSAENSRVKVIVIPTDEELVIASDTLKIVSSAES
jgi:acetate kinase